MTTGSANSSIPPTSPHLISTMTSEGYWQCECGKTLRFASRLSGKRGRCPACSRHFVIPALAPVEGAWGTLRGHNGPIRAVAFSPDRRLLATAAEVVSPPAARSELAETFLWDVNSGLLLTRLHWHRDCVASLAFAPDRGILATAGKDNAVSIWNVERGLWDAVIGVHERALHGHRAPVSAVAFSPSTACLVTAAADQTLRFWDSENWAPIRTIEVGRAGECRIAFSPCGRYLASVWSSRGPATIFTADGQRHLEFRLPAEEDSGDSGVAFSPDGSRLIVLSDHQVRIWDISTCQVLSSFEAPGSESLAVSPQGLVIATGGYDRETKASVTLWNAASLDRAREFAGHGQAVSALAFSSDGTMLVSGGRDGVVNVWQVG